MKRVLLLIAAFFACLSCQGIASAEVPVDTSWLAPEAFSIDTSDDVDLMDPAEVAREIRELRDQHEEEISTPSAVAERIASSDQFTDLGTNAAIQLVTDVFDEPLEALTTLPSDVV